MQKADCIFCQIAQGKAPSHIIWENEKYLAFLSIFPNTEGFTIVASKDHLGSYVFDQTDEVISELMVATKKVAKILDNYFEDVGRCGLICEGYGVDHLHSKLYPMHGTGNMEEWAMIESETFDKYFDRYPGYIASNSSHRADDKKLAELAKKIKTSYGTQAK